MDDNNDPPLLFEGVDRETIKSASRRGIIISGGAQAIRFVAQFVSSVLMIRLLMPKDFGLVAMAAPISAFVQLLADLGLNQATVQRAKISQAELSFLFWVGLAASIGVGCIVIASAPFAALFYGEPRVTDIVIALGAVVMLSGAFSQHLAILNRSLRFGTLALVEVGGFFIGSSIGILTAWLGWAYWSIVAGLAMTSVSSMTLAWCLAGWRPSRPAMVPTARSMLGFGGHVTGFNLMNFLSRNLDNVLLGRFSGEAQLGLYDRAYKLLLFPLNQISGPITKIANPVLARALPEPQFYRRAYFRLLGTVLMLTYPLAIFSGINNHGIVSLLLGEQWIHAAPIFAVLAIGALVAPISSSTTWLLITQGRVAELRNYSIVSGIAFISSFVLGLRWGPLGVAVCYICVGLVQGPLIWLATTRRGPVNFKSLMVSIVPYAFAAVPVAIMNILVVLCASESILMLVGSAVASYALFALALSVSPAGRSTLRPLVDHGIHWFASFRIKRET